VAAAANVAVAAAVPAAAVNVTLTPVFQLAVVSVTDAGVKLIAVLPVRVSVTVTFPEGAALNRMLDVPLAPPANDSEVGFGMIVGVDVPPTVKVTIGDAALSGGVPLSNAVACAVWFPGARPLVLKLYGAVVSLFTSAPSTRNSTRLIDPLESLAVAVSGTAPVVND
jgi:hypothetical protein